MNTNTFNRQKRQFMNLANRVSNLVISGEWIMLSASTRNRIILKLNSLYRQLCSYFTQPELRKILAAAAIFIGLPIASQAQSFAPPQQNPFGLAPDSVYLAAPAFADIDNDGDIDLLTGNYGPSGIGFHFFENTGTASAPAFAAHQENPYGLSTPSSYVAFPAFADIDNDGDLDLFTGEISEADYESKFEFFENTGTVNSPAFALPVTNPFGLSPTYIFAIPTFADIDNDGDLDLFAGEGYGDIQFFQNTGSATEANFAPPVENPFGLTPAYNFGAPAFADIDSDGDLDLFVGEYYGNMQFFENTGTISAPSFAPKVTNPFGLVATNFYSFPAIADLDADGDFDIMVGEYYGMFQYFKNTEINIGIGENQVEELFSLYPNPATDMVHMTLLNENSGNPLQVIIIDLNGRVVKVAEITTKDLRLTTEDLSPGVYFVRLVQGDRVGVRKLVVRI